MIIYIGNHVMSTVRISDKNKALVKDCADQLNTSVKSVIDMILEWFFDTDWGNPDVIARLGLEGEDVLDEDEDEDEDKEEEEEE